MLFDQQFETKITRHSTTASHRVFLMNCGRLREFHQRLKQEDARLVLEITGASSLPDVRYEVSRFIAYDPQGDYRDDEPMLLEPNTTTLVDVVLNRRQSDRLLVIKDCQLAIVQEAEAAVVGPATGRAELVVRERAVSTDRPAAGQKP